MSYIALYRKWRPSIFEDVVEQEHVVKTLKNSIKTDRIAHAYLFCGTRGTGKTTMAKIFSRAINCVNPKDGNPCNVCEICVGILAGNILDVVEIDAASNNSVDNVREIRDEVIYTPSQAKFKVYIIDEVHMLSSGAFNALLKTLEEPPKHVVFILATTEAHKLPVTILSRCQRFDFRRITVESIMGQVEKISLASDVGITKDAARLIAKMADGALRDAISILDQCISVGSSQIAYEDVLKVVGTVNSEFIEHIIIAINKKEIGNILEQIEALVLDGKDLVQFLSELISYYRNLLICKVTKEVSEIIEASSENIEKMKLISKDITEDRIMYYIKELSLTEASLKWATHPRVLLEVLLIKLCQTDKGDGSLSLRVEAIEKQLSEGVKVVNVVEEKKDYEIRENIHVDNKYEQPQKRPDNAFKESKPKISTEMPSTFISGGKEFENWADVIKTLKSAGRMALYTNLLGTKAIEIDEKIMAIIFEDNGGFKRMFVSKPENLEVIEAAITAKIKRQIKVKCLFKEDLKSVIVKKHEEKDEFMEKAEKLAKRLDVPMNVIDE